MDRNKYYTFGEKSTRDDSPYIKNAFQDKVHLALTTLLETKGIYQNVCISNSFANKFDSPDEFKKEFGLRPLDLYSRDDGKGSPRGLNIGGFTSAHACKHHNMRVGCFLPNINLECSICKNSSSFISTLCSYESNPGIPYPEINKKTIQVYSITYKCATCHNEEITFQILRTGLKLQLTGRTIPFRPKISKEWPKIIRNIVEDAALAAAENDMPAAYYHLRTALEHYIKTVINVDVKEKYEGSDLCDEYNKTLDEYLKINFQSVSPIYTDLSLGLHSREVTEEGFSRLFNQLLAHFESKNIFTKHKKTSK